MPGNLRSGNSEPCTKTTFCMSFVSPIYPYDFVLFLLSVLNFSFTLKKITTTKLFFWGWNFSVIYVVLPNLLFIFPSVRLSGAAGLSVALQEADQCWGRIHLYQYSTWVPCPLLGQPVWPGHPAFSQDAQFYKWSSFWIRKSSVYYWIFLWNNLLPNIC